MPLRGVIMSVLWVMGFVSWPAWAQVRLLTDTQLVSGKQQAIQIQINGDLAGSLVLELDGVDLSALIRREGDRLEVVPPKVLAVGRHELKLLLETPDGELRELGVWMLQVRASEIFDQWNGHWQADLGIQGRLDASPPAGTTDWSVDGALSGRGEGVRGKWRTQAQVDIQYDGTATGGDEVALSQYLLRLQRGGASLSAGHQSLLGESLISDGLTHRGVQINLDTPRALPLAARVFVGRPDGISTFSHPLGVDDAGNRVVGGGLRFAPVRSRKYLQVEGGVYGGDATDVSTGWSQSGSGWSVAVSDRWLNRRLSIRAELAGTSWDADGSGTLASMVEDRAWRINSNYQVAAGEWRWLIQAGYGHVGPYFVSLLNPVQQVDQRGGRLSVAFSRDNWRGAFSWQRLRDNVEDDPALLTTQTEDVQAQLGYQFEQSGRLGFKGVNLALSSVYRRPKRIPSGYLGTVLDDRTDEVSIQVDWQIVGLTGQGGWMYSRLDDFRNSLNNSETRQWQLTLQRSWELTGGRALSFATSWQQGDTDYVNLGQRVRN